MKNCLELINNGAIPDWPTLRYAEHTEVAQPLCDEPYIIAGIKFPVTDHLWEKLETGKHKAYGFSYYYKCKHFRSEEYEIRFGYVIHNCDEFIPPQTIY